MPTGIPVATVAIDGAANAAILAAQILSLSDDELASKLFLYKKELETSVSKRNERLAEKLSSIGE
jgi:5-(carboxyamino)imidazole ribonucleotide mutase